MGEGWATKDDDERIGKVLVRGRRCGAIPWEAIGDSRTESALPFFYSGPDGFRASMRGAAERYRLDRQEGQERYLEVVVEARGAVEQVWRTTSPYSVPVYSGSGFSTVTSCASPSSGRRRDAPTTILVLGDYDDPSGIDIRLRVRGDIEAFALEHDAEIGVEEIALTEEHVEALGLIKAPLAAKKRERFPCWPHNWTVELEALSPEALASILHEALETRTSTAVREELAGPQQTDRSSWSARSAARGPRHERPAEPHRRLRRPLEGGRPPALQELPAQARR